MARSRRTSGRVDRNRSVRTRACSLAVGAQGGVAVAGEADAAPDLLAERAAHPVEGASHREAHGLVGEVRDPEVAGKQDGAEVLDDRHDGVPGGQHLPAQPLVVPPGEAVRGRAEGLHDRGQRCLVGEKRCGGQLVVETVAAHRPFPCLRQATMLPATASMDSSLTGRAPGWSWGRRWCCPPPSRRPRRGTRGSVPAPWHRPAPDCLPMPSRRRRPTGRSGPPRCSG